MVITAGSAMRNASIYIGNDTGSVSAANTLAAAGISIPARSTVAVPTAGAPPGRYVLVWTGMASEVGACCFGCLFFVRRVRQISRGAPTKPGPHVSAPAGN